MDVDAAVLRDQQQGDAFSDLADAFSSRLQELKRFALLRVEGEQLSERPLGRTRVRGCGRARGRQLGVWSGPKRSAACAPHPTTPHRRQVQGRLHTGPGGPRGEVVPRGGRRSCRRPSSGARCPAFACFGGRFALVKSIDKHGAGGASGLRRAASERWRSTSRSWAWSLKRRMRPYRRWVPGAGSTCDGASRAVVVPPRGQHPAPLHKPGCTCLASSRIAWVFGCDDAATPHAYLWPCVHLWPCVLRRWRR